MCVKEEEEGEGEEEEEEEEEVDIQSAGHQHGYFILPPLLHVRRPVRLGREAGASEVVAASPRHG
eukprot:39436-Hanusia_phi.AAC.1